MRLLALLLPRPDKQAFLEGFSPAWLPSEIFISLYKSLDFFYDGRTALSPEQWFAGLPAGCQTMAREALLAADELSANLPLAEAAFEIERLRSRLKNYHQQNQLKDIREKIKQAEGQGNGPALRQHLEEWKKLSAELR